jgi:hypothetical protein
VGERNAEAVLISGVYGAGKSSVAEEIAFLLEQRGVLYALLDLDYLGWASAGSGSCAAGFRLMLRNLEAVAANYLQAGIRLLVLAMPGRLAGGQIIRQPWRCPVGPDGAIRAMAWPARRSTGWGPAGMVASVCAATACLWPSRG